VTVSLAGTNAVSPLRFFRLLDQAGNSFQSDRTLADSRTYRLRAGTWIFNVLAGNCSTNQVVVVPECTNLCEILDVDVAVSDCLPGGQAEITVELSATNTIGETFVFELRQGGQILVPEPTSGVYTNTPSVFRLLVQSTGEPVDLTVSQSVRVHQGSFRGCSTQLVDIAIPDCFMTPPVCLMVPPRIIDIDPNPVPNQRLEPILSYTAPTNVTVLIERCDDDLTTPWFVLSESTAAVDAPQSFTNESYFFPRPGDRTFYRIRCKPVPVPTP